MVRELNAKHIHWTVRKYQPTTDSTTEKHSFTIWVWEEVSQIPGTRKVMTDRYDSIKIKNFCTTKTL